MIVRLPDDTEVEAFLSTEHPASSYGRPVLIADGLPYGSWDAGVLELVSATPEEKSELDRGQFLFGVLKT